mgnify:CR=1 FL=1
MTSFTIQPVILTTPSRRNQYVNEIIKSLSVTDKIETPIVYEDSHMDGAAVSTRNAINLAAERGGHVLFLEDDIIVAPDALKIIPEVIFPENVGVISFCDMREIKEFSPNGLYICSALGSDQRGWWGNQAILIHRDIVKILSRQDWFDREIENSRGVRAHIESYCDAGSNCSDIRLSLIVNKHGGARNHYAVFVPSLFKHVGHESVCFPGRGMGERETRNWIEDRKKYGID